MLSNPLASCSIRLANLARSKSVLSRCTAPGYSSLRMVIICVTSFNACMVLVVS